MAATADSWDDGLAIVQVVWRRRRLVAAAAAVSMAATFAMVWWRAPVYEATASLLVLPSKAQPAQVSGSFLLSDLANLEEARSRRTMQTLLESEFVEREVYASLPTGVAKVVHGPTDLPVKIENPAGTEILEVRAQSTDKEAAVGLANAVARKAADLGTAIGERASTQGGTRLKSELARSRQEVEAANLALKRFCEQHGVTDLPAEMAGLTQKLVDLQGRVTDARVSLKARRAEIAAALQASKEEPAMVAGGSATVTGPLLESVLPKPAGPAPKEAAPAPSAPSGTQAGAAPGEHRSPLMDTVQQQPNPVLRDLLIRMASLRTGEASLSARLQALEEETSRLERRYDELRRLEPEWKRLSSAYTVLQQSYEAMLTNQEALEVSRTARLPEAQIVAEAQLSPYPVSPRKVLDLAAALVLGLFVGLVGALLLERRTGMRASTVNTAVGVEAHQGDLSRV